MRRPITILVFLITLGAFWNFAAVAEAVPQEKGAEVQKQARGLKATTEDSSLDKDKKIVLPPFFQPQKKDSRMWIERIIITFLMAMPKDLPKYDFNSPTLRKMLYDMLLSEEPDTAIKSQVLSSLNKQLGINIDATIQISRSTIIVR